MSVTVKIKIPSVQQLLERCGVTPTGDVQAYWTSMVNKRLTRYMPYRSGALATKLKQITGPTTITVSAPYARYQYYGKAMVNAATGNGPRYIPGIGFRWPKGATLAVTDRDLQYDTTKNAAAGPFWDRRLVSAEQSAMLAEMRRYIAGRSRK